MKTPQIGRSVLRVRRGIVLFVAGALALGLGVAGVSTVLASGPPATRPDPNATVIPDQPVAPAAVTSPVPPVSTTQPSPTNEPASDPTELADGVYATYVRAVDVKGATVTVDVLQAFVGGAAHQAAIEDGVSWKDVRHDPVYIRNENRLLRTLPVDRDVNIQFIDTCESPNRSAGLTQLRREMMQLNEIFYYEILVADSNVIRIMQKVSVAGC
jgi:hypothetical protein